MLSAAKAKRAGGSAGCEAGQTPVKGRVLALLLTLPTAAALGIPGATVPPGGRAGSPTGQHLHHLPCGLSKICSRHLEMRPPQGCSQVPAVRCYWLLTAPPRAWTGRLAQHLPSPKRTGKSSYRIILDWLLLQGRHLPLGWGRVKTVGQGIPGGTTPPPLLGWSLLGERPSKSGVSSRGETPHSSCWI